MELTEQETDLVEWFRECANGLAWFQITARFEDGIWECVTTQPLHPSHVDFRENYLHLPRLPPGFVVTSRGVGTTIVEAINNLAGNDDERAV